MLYTRDQVIEQGRVLANTLGTEWVTQSQIETMANQANELVYRQMLNTCPDIITRTTAFTYPANITSVDLSGASYLGETPMRVKSVEDTASTGPYSTTNWTRAWERTTYEELLRYRTSKLNIAAPTTGMMPKILYAVDQSSLVIAPAQSIGLNCRVRWVPYLQPMTSGTDPVLAGFETQFGQVVGYGIAYLINVRQGGINQGITKLWEDAIANVKTTADERVRGPTIVHNSRIEQFR